MFGKRGLWWVGLLVGSVVVYAVCASIERAAPASRYIVMVPMLLANLAQFVSIIVLVLIALRGFFGGGAGTRDGEAAFRSIEKQRADDQRVNERYQQKFKNF